MNRTFKVVFSKVRGTMVVASEAAATPHKKAAKTVIAAAAALAMGTAMAQEWAPEGALDIVGTPVTQEQLDGNSQFDYTLDGARTEGFHTVSEGKVTFSKDVWVTGTNGARSHALHAVGGETELTNTGNIYVQAGEGSVSWSQKGMMAGSGATIINEGNIVAKNAYGMTIENKGPASTIINNRQITVLEQGAGIELGGVSGSLAVNNGTITVSDITEERNGEFFGHGVLINTSNNTLVNNGTISAEGEHASAIEVKDNADGATVILGSTSKVLGKIHFSDTVEHSRLIANGAVDTIDLVSEAGDLELDIVNGANLTLKDGNASTYGEVNIDDGRLNASIWQDDNKFKHVNVNEGGIFNVTKLNSGGDPAEPSTHNKLLLAKGSSYTLNGGKLFVAGSEWQEALKVGEADTEGTLTIASGSYNYSTLEVAKQGTVNVKYGELTVGDLSFSNGKVGNEGSVVIAQDGSMNINGKLTEMRVLFPDLLTRAK